MNKGKAKKEKGKISEEELARINDHWIKFDRMKIWEAILLLYRQRPERQIHYNNDERDSFVYKELDEQLSFEQLELLDLAKRSNKYSSTNIEEEMININDFFQWAAGKGYPKDNLLINANFFEKLNQNKSSINLSDNSKVSKKILFSFKKNKGETWEFIFNGEKSPAIKEFVGLKYIQELLRKPDEPIQCIDICRVNKTIDENEHTKYYEDIDESNNIFSFSRLENENISEDDILELREIQNKIDICEETGDSSQSNKLKMRLNELASQFLGTSSKKTISKQEIEHIKKPRNSVAKAIKEAINKIDTVLPSLATHLKDHIEYGKSITYKPHKEIDWQF